VVYVEEKLVEFLAGIVVGHVEELSARSRLTLTNYPFVDGASTAARSRGKL
jgi:hypothetical protein